MIRINCHILKSPPQIDCVVEVIQWNGGFSRVYATLDTGAGMSLFPMRHMAEFRYENPRTVEIEQAGIAKQAFAATEATILLKFVDPQGLETSVMPVRVWFTESNLSLIGMLDTLEHTTIHADIPLRAAYLEFAK